MVRLAYCSLAVALAGCPAKNTTPHEQGAGCPPAAGVFPASYVTQEATKGRSGWVAPLHATSGVGAVAAPYTQIDAAAASAAGVPPPPTGTLWLSTPSAPLCRVTVGKHYAAQIEGPPASVSYGVELEGCPPPKNAEEGGGFVFVSEQPPSGCRFEMPKPIAARMGQMDANKQWQRPTTETPIPPPLVAAIGDKECAAPECEKLWAFLEVKIAGQTAAWSGVVNWLKVGAPADQCSWPSERESGVWIPASGGAVKVTEGQERSLPLTAVLADGKGAKVMLAEGPGDFATYDLAPGRASLGHHIKWQVLPSEVWEHVDDIGPICEGATRSP